MTHNGKKMKTSRIILFWMPMIVIGMANGLFRELVLRTIVHQEALARQLSTGTLMLLLTLYILGIYGAMKIGSANQTLRIGAMWALLTFTFETFLGYFVSHLTIQQMAGEYNLAQGKLWSLVLVLLLVLPYIKFQFTRLKDDARNHRTAQRLHNDL